MLNENSFSNSLNKRIFLSSMNYKSIIQLILSTCSHPIRSHLMILLMILHSLSLQFNQKISQSTALRPRGRFQKLPKNTVSHHLCSLASSKETPSISWQRVIPAKSCTLSKSTSYRRILWSWLATRDLPKNTAWST